MSTKLDDIEKDMLLEAASIAAGKTIKPISAITKQETTIAPPELALTSMEHIADLMGKPQNSKVVVRIHISGEAKGAMLLMLDPDDMKQLLPHVSDELKISALEEMSNIVAGTSLGSLTKLLGMLLVQSVPTTATDMLRAVINEAVAEVGGADAEILCMINKLTIGSPLTTIPVSIYLLFDSDTTAAILRATKQLKGQYGGSV